MILANRAKEYYRKLTDFTLQESDKRRRRRRLQGTYLALNSVGRCLFKVVMIVVVVILLILKMVLLVIKWN